MKRRKILVIEDDQDIADLLKIHLGDLDCDVDLAMDGPTGLHKADPKVYEMIILDVMLPGMDGLEICKRIRNASTYIPILMLTAKTSEMDRVTGLEIGADDYLTKPFSVKELQARVKALFRLIQKFDTTAQPDSTESRIQAGDLTIDTEKRTVLLHGTPSRLTVKEFDLLVQFARTPGRVYTRTQLIELVWGYSYQGYEHTVNSHINRLRAKIEEDPAHPKYILTVFGVGYKFADFSEETLNHV